MNANPETDVAAPKGCDSSDLLVSDVFRAFAAMARNAMTESTEDERLNVEAKDYYRALTHETRKMIFADLSASMAMTSVPIDSINVIEQLSPNSPPDEDFNSANAPALMPPCVADEVAHGRLVPHLAKIVGGDVDGVIAKIAANKCPDQLRTWAPIMCYEAELLVAEIHRLRVRNAERIDAKGVR